VPLIASVPWHGPRALALVMMAVMMAEIIVVRSL